MSETISTTPEQTHKNNKSTKWVIFVILALFIGGAVGYALGAAAKESEIQASFDQQTQQLEDEIDALKLSTGIKLDDGQEALTEGQEAITEGQQTLESLQAENAALKATIEEQNKKIADLEMQLEAAQDTTTPAEQNQTN